MWTSIVFPRYFVTFEYVAGINSFSYHGLGKEETVVKTTTTVAGLNNLQNTPVSSFISKLEISLFILG
jgi:hypothetical protein